MTPSIVARGRWAAGISLAALLTSASPVLAQVVERHLPPAPQAGQSVIAPPNALPADQDATPIGPALRAVVLLEPNASVRANVADGLDVAAATRVNPKRLARALKPFLGRPLSRRLIGEVEARIARAYRAVGYPFVRLATPEQEITSGALQITVMEFKAGKITAAAKSAAEADYLTSHVRLQSGEPVNSVALSEDLDWLNRYPFRQTAAVFAPGAEPGQTDLTLQTTHSKPWQVYAGYADSGSASTGWDRYFVGAEVGGLITPDSFASFQATTSGDGIFYKQRPFNSSPNPAYVSYAGRIVIPTNPRGELEASVDWVVTDEASSPFMVRQTTLEGSLGYRFALSDTSPGDPTLLGLGDARIGVEAKSGDSKTLFQGIDAYDVSAQVYQAYAGWEKTEQDPFGHSDLDLEAHMSPGGIDGENSDAQMRLYSQGRVGSARYAYTDLNFSRTTQLVDNFTWTLQAIGQYSPRALPRTEQVGLGGQSLVRGYSLDDGAYDSAIVVRNELRAPPIAWRQEGQGFAMGPYAFVDAGVGRDQFTKQSVTAASTGLGSDLQLTNRLALTVEGAYALKSALYTKSGDTMVETRLTFSY
jgi:hemolysin activation/secretion protein